MSATTDLSCRDIRRRSDVRSAPLFGLDFVDIGNDATEKVLEVFFLGKGPATILPANVRIDGGETIQNIRAVSVTMQPSGDKTLDDSMEVTLNKYGDYSIYTLSLVELDAQGQPTDTPLAGFDPKYNSVQFSFKAGCPSDLDCQSPHVCPPPVRVQPEINYLAKDYASFRQLILDRLALTMPAWQESHAPDLGITLVELLAYVGDYLSYYQDAVATEAYLGTARQRISVRRHARLVDYTMHEGCNARAWITLNWTTTDLTLQDTLDLTNIYFITGFPGSPAPGILQSAHIGAVPSGTFEIFEPLVKDISQPFPIFSAHSEIHFYAWGNCQCCLRKGATSATLADQWISKDAAVAADKAAASTSDGPPGTVRALQLQVGDVLIFEEVLGPRTGNPADADPTHRQAVRLTKVTRSVDPLYHPNGPNFGMPIVEIEWCPDDALNFPLCISWQEPAPKCGCLENVSVARGNVILVDHGAMTAESLGVVCAETTVAGCPTKCSPAETSIVPARFRPLLKQNPLTFAEPLPPCGCASAMIATDPREALPQIVLASTEQTPQGAISIRWSAKQDLLESGPTDADFVVEVDNDGGAHLRFGDGSLGLQPDAGTSFNGEYRVGNGTAGNVGAETIVYLVFRQLDEGHGPLIPRNPLPASGGTESEPMVDVKLFAPYAFQSVLERAITANDYASLAADNARRIEERVALIEAALSQPAIPAPTLPVDEERKREEEEPNETPQLGPEICSTPFQPLQAAKGDLRWTGSWYEALVAVDPENSDAASGEALLEIDAYLEPYRRMGHDLEVQLADYVPLDVALTICVLPNFQRAHVESALLDVFSNGVRPDGSLGFFDPDNLTFGQGIYASRIIAAAQAVPGVQEAQLTRLEPFTIGTPAQGLNDRAQVPSDGVLEMGPFQIARLDNDPSAPQNGRLTLNLRGGR